METITLISAKKSLPALIWLLKARSTKEESRYVLTGMLIDDQNWVCTDSRRLHCVKKANMPDIPAGVWDVKVLKDQIIFIRMDVQFPDYKAVMPVYPAPGKKFLLELEKADGYTLSSAIIRISRDLQKNKAGVNIDFINDLIGDTWEIRAHATDITKALLFLSAEKTALVMPFIINSAA